MRRWSAGSIMLLCFAFIFPIMAQNSTLPDLTVESKNRTINISVIKRVTQRYYLLTKDNPLNLTIVGPNWVRVYTRLLFLKGMAEKANYKIVISEDEEERIVSLVTEKSKSAIGPGNKEFGKWRSFFIEVPKGENHYKFSLWQAPSDTVAVRFSLEEPKEWTSLRFEPGTAPDNFQLIASEAGKTIDYYELTTDKPIRLELTGPLRIKVATRLNYDITLDGAQKFAIRILEDGKEQQTATFRVIKSETIKYQNKADMIPSLERSFYLQIPEGKHKFEFQLIKTQARSAGLRFLSKAPEKYE